MLACWASSSPQGVTASLPQAKPIFSFCLCFLFWFCLRIPVVSAVSMSRRSLCDAVYICVFTQVWAVVFAFTDGCDSLWAWVSLENTGCADWYDLGCDEWMFWCEALFATWNGVMLWWSLGLWWAMFLTDKVIRWYQYMILVFIRGSFCSYNNVRWPLFLLFFFGMYSILSSGSIIPTLRRISSHYHSVAPSRVINLDLLTYIAVHIKYK